MKLLTVVTIVYNDFQGLKRTRESLLNKPSWVEWVVIDGLSSDIPEGYLSDLSDQAIVISEKDSGIADAFNKGIALSNGEFVLFINAGDRLSENFFDELELMNINENFKGKLIVGKVKFGQRLIGDKVSFIYQSIRNRLPHQGCIFHYTLFEKYGMYDTSYRLGMDYEWSLRLKYVWNNIVCFSPLFVSFMDENGRSISNYKTTYLKYHEARIKNKTMPSLFSAFLSFLFIKKVTLGNYLRSRFGH
ncbi:glycosyltransferase [Acinetobacter venetianus]|uniref:glycosyltransferase n=1 Tax=Acinetobacter venetianus TaxID=52133 RepID=UPI003A8FD0E9